MMIIGYGYMKISKKKKLFLSKKKFMLRGGLNFFHENLPPRHSG